MNKSKRLLIIGVALLVILSCKPSGTDVLPTITPIPPTAAPPQATPSPEETPKPQAQPVDDDRQTLQNLLRSTVQIFALVESGGRLQTVWTGSGSILSPDCYHISYLADELIEVTVLFGVLLLVNMP